MAHVQTSMSGRVLLRESEREMSEREEKRGKKEREEREGRGEIDPRTHAPWARLCPEVINRVAPRSFLPALVLLNRILAPVAAKLAKAAARKGVDDAARRRPNVELLSAVDSPITVIVDAFVDLEADLLRFARLRRTAVEAQCAGAAMILGAQSLLRMLLVAYDSVGVTSSTSKTARASRAILEDRVVAT